MQERARDTSQFGVATMEELAELVPRSLLSHSSRFLDACGVRFNSSANLQGERYRSLLRAGPAKSFESTL